MKMKLTRIKRFGIESRRSFAWLFSVLALVFLLTLAEAFLSSVSAYGQAVCEREGIEEPTDSLPPWFEVKPHDNLERRPGTEAPNLCPLSNCGVEIRLGPEEPRSRFPGE